MIFPSLVPKTPSICVLITTETKPAVLISILQFVLAQKTNRIQVLLFDHGVTSGYLEVFKMLRSRGSWLRYKHTGDLPFKQWMYQTVAVKHAGNWFFQLGATPEQGMIEEALSLWGMVDPAPDFLVLAGNQKQGQGVIRVSHLGGSFLTTKQGIQSLADGGSGVIYQCPRSLVNAILVSSPPPPSPTVKPTSQTRQAAFLVPTYQRPQLLNCCLRALKTQTVPEGWTYNILVSGTVNDPGKAVAAAFGATWVDSPTESVTTKLNTCLKRTNAELVLLADDDDIQPPTRLKAAIEAYLEGADWSGSGTLCFYHIAENKVVRWTGKASLGLVGTSLSFSMSLLRRIGGWPEKVKGKDGPMTRRIQKSVPTPVFKDISNTMGFLLCQQHEQNLWKRPVLEKGQTRRRGKFDLVGLGPLSGVKMPPETEQALLNSAINAPIQVYITSYDRPQEALLLLQDLDREQKYQKLHVTLYDDGSPSDYSRVQDFLKQHFWSYVKLPHGGKQQYLQLGLRIFKDALKANPQGGYFFQDDIRLCEGFFGVSEKMWEGIPDPQKASLFLFKDSMRTGIAPWTAYKATSCGAVNKTQWVDGVAFKFGGNFLQQVIRGVPPIPSMWFKDPTHGSGFGRQLSLMLHQRGFGMYQVLESLVVHTESLSRLNPIARLKDRLPTSNFVGGQAAANLLQKAPLLGDKRCVASLASIASREESLKEVVRRILPQVDRLNVYLNEYGRVPDFLKHEKIVVERSETCSFGDQGDAGKFYWADVVTGYHIVIDDDIAYPPDFVSTLVSHLNSYALKAVVGCHGAVLKEPFDSYYKSRKVYHFRTELQAPAPVHVLGTGCLAYHTDTIRVSRTDFKHPNMADIWFALLGQQQKVPFICIPHRNDWLTDLAVTDSIWEASRKGASSTKNTGEVQTRVVKESLPWEIHRIQEGKVQKAAFLVSTTNRPEMLQRALESLQKQKIPVGWEVEILVGGLTHDPGKAIAEKLGIKYVEVTSPYPGSKLNACAFKTDAELLLAADDDDVQDPLRLTETVRAFNRGHEWLSTSCLTFIDAKTGKKAFWQGPAQGVGTTMTLTRNLFDKVGGWPQVSRGKEGLLEQRLKKLGVSCFDLGLKETYCYHHEKSLWTHPFPDVGTRCVYGHFVVTGVR